MFKYLKSFVVAAMIVIAGANLSGCTRIETGEAGLRVNASKQVQGTELVEGSWNQIIIGDVLTFPVRDVVASLKDHKPLTAENTQLADLDYTVIYSINPSAVSELWSKKSKSFHYFDKEEGDWLLMYNYVWTVASNAAVKIVRQYKALEVADKREEIEQKIRDTIVAELAKEKLETSIQINRVSVQSILPNNSIVAAATDAIKATQQLAVATAQVEIAKKEAERMAALASNATNSIAYMNAQAQADIAKAVREGKVNTIVIPYDFKGIVNVGK